MLLQKFPRAIFRWHHFRTKQQGSGVHSGAGDGGDSALSCCIQAGAILPLLLKDISPVEQVPDAGWMVPFSVHLAGLTERVCGFFQFFFVLVRFFLQGLVGGFLGSLVLLIVPGLLVFHSRPSFNQHVSCKCKVEWFFLFLYLFCPIRMLAFLDKKATDDVCV